MKFKKIRDEKTKTGQARRQSKGILKKRTRWIDEQPRRPKGSNILSLYNIPEIHKLEAPIK